MSRLNVFAVALVLAPILSGAAIPSAQSLRELARQQAIRNPDVPLEHPAPPADLWPKSIEELTAEADLILQAKLSRTTSYLSESEDRVLTDYAILAPSVIVGHLPVPSARVPGEVPPLTVTVYGGEVVVEGVTIRGTDNSRAPLRNGGEYVLFLKRSRSAVAGQYEIYYGGIFDISQGKVKPLLGRGGEVFKGTVDAAAKDFISRIKDAGARAVRN